MSPSGRFVVNRILLQRILSTLAVVALTLIPVLALAEEDPCREMGIYIGNQTSLDVWYTRDGGPCTKWNQRHILIMKPEDTLIIYRDMTCKTEYCPQNPTYDVCKSLDADRDCRVRILPSCTLSDM